MRARDIVTATDGGRRATENCGVLAPKTIVRLSVGHVGGEGGDEGYRGHQG